jgi:hypothetical protein
MIMKSITFLICTAMLLSACKKDKAPVAEIENPDDVVEEWLIPFIEVKDGGVGKDGIRSIDTPIILEANAVSILKDDDLVLGLKYGNTAVAYPHKILNYHEIVNHSIEDFTFSITYCPLTGTGVLYDRKIDDKITTFGVSGLLYNSNLILYDRETESKWPQMMLKSVNGAYKGKENTFHQLIATTWATWKKWYPETKVLGMNETLGINYETYPYGDYVTNNDRLLFSVTTKLRDIPQKERILGIRINDKVSHVRFSDFIEGKQLVKRYLSDETVYVFGSEKENYMFAYFGKTTTGSAIKVDEVLLGKENETLFVDTEGNKWNIMGVAIEGTRTGQKLQSPENYMGYAFAWGAFYPNFFALE